MVMKTRVHEGGWDNNGGGFDAAGVANTPEDSSYREMSKIAFEIFADVQVGYLGAFYGFARGSPCRLRVQYPRHRIFRSIANRRESFPRRESRPDVGGKFVSVARSARSLSRRLLQF